MDPEHFERLSRRIALLTTSVRDSRELLEAARYALEGDAAVLVNRNCSLSLSHEVVLGLPPPPDIQVLSGWYASVSRKHTIDGCFYEGDPLRVGDDRFEGAVVGFGERHDLLVLRHQCPSGHYESYHAWALASLLHAFESHCQRILQGQILDLQGLLINTYRKDWGTLVREDTPWSTINTVLKGISDPCVRRELQDLCACEYIGYHSRLAWARPESIERAIPEPIPAPPTTTDSPTGPNEPTVDARLNAAYREAYLQLGKPELIFACPKVHGALEHIGDDAHANGPSFVEGTSGPRERLDRVALLLLEHGWRLVLKRAQRTNIPACWRSSGGDKATEPSPPSVDDLSRSATVLLKLSVRLFAARVADGWDETQAGIPRSERQPSENTGSTHSETDSNAQLPGQGGRPSSTEESPLPVGRAVLWSYFGYLVARSKPLIATYLGSSEGPATAPQDPRREYLIHLARFFLGLVERLERYRNMDTRTRTVSPHEVLDATVYLVDRYAHRGLGVPEWIDIRHHLARALRAEIDHHLSSSHYRDHLLHVVDVFLLGHLLLHTRVKLTDPQGKPFVEQLAICSGDCGSGPEYCTCSRVFDPVQCLRNWAVAALLHDIGYQLIRAGQITTDPKVQMAYFGLEATAPLSRLAPNDDAGETPLQHVVRNLRPLPDVSKSWLEELPSAPNDARLMDHGVLSSLRLAQLLFAMGQQDPVRNDGQCRLVNEYEPALHAIYHHNLADERVFVRTHPLSCLLRLCDELQEWARQRVNIEAMVKQLYLAIEGEPTIELDRNRLLSQVHVNIRGQLNFGGCEDDGDELTFILEEEESNDRRGFCFRLDYEDPKQGAYDPVLTLLMKAYNLQHLDFSGPNRSDDRRQRWRVELRFPRSFDHGTSTEYDIYCQFAEQRARWLPMLHGTQSAGTETPGLARLEADSSRTGIPPDHYVVVAHGRASSNTRQGWLTSDPRSVVKSLIDFRKSYSGA